MAGLDYDVVVVGSGFGGSVAALRLTEKGYRVAVLEAGQRFDDPSRDAPADRHRALPRNSWHTRRYLWAPALRAFGIQRIHLTAQAERAMAAWPNRGDPDPRPPLGAPYQRVAAVPPARPAVPAAAPAALRVPA